MNMNKENIKSRYRTIMTWEGGQRLFNFAYSIGAAIVICGALFKILHIQEATPSCVSAWARRL